MIHFTCDLCGRPLAANEPRYVVEMQIYPAADESTPEGYADDPDIDYLEELNEMIEQVEIPSDQDLVNDSTKHIKLDLCPHCCKQFSKNPLNREAPQLNFSQN